MSFHKNPKYQIPELIQALKDHGLEHDTPSQLADAFRTGWVAKAALLASAAGGEPKAWLTEHDSGDMVWTDKTEAEAYSDDSGPIPLYAHPPAAVRQLTPFEVQEAWASGEPLCKISDVAAPPPPVGELQGVSEAELHEFKVRLTEYGMAMRNSEGARAQVLSDVLVSMLQSFAASRPVAGLSPTQESKYTVNGSAIVNRATGEPIPADEPVFIFRARDRQACSILGEYAQLCENAVHRDAVNERFIQFGEWADAHPERMKEPDTATGEGKTS